MSVISVGNNKNGQLGIENIKEHLEPKVLESLKGKVIVSCSSGEAHNICVSRFGDVYSWGRGKEGQLGVPEKMLFSTKPNLIKTLLHERVVKVACGNFHSLALTDQGRVYEWGQLHKIDDSKTGLEATNGLLEMPGMSKPKYQSIIENSVSQYLNGEKEIYDSTSGNNDDDDEASTSEQSKGKHIGKIIDYNQTTPIQVQGLLANEEVIDISAGWAFSAAVTKSGKIFTWGFNEKGQLGLKHRWFNSSPQLVKTLLDVKIVSVSCGRQHIGAVTEDGDLYTWGLGVFGQLGHSNVKSYLHPKKVAAFSLNGIQVSQVSCGSNFTMVLGRNQILYAFGHGEYAQLGATEETQHLDMGSRDNHFKYSSPKVVEALEDKKIKYVTCGHLHTLALTEDNEVYVWGWGSSGCLGLNSKRFQLVPQLVTSISGEEISCISAGEKHSLIVRGSDLTSFAFDYKGLVNEKKYSDISFTVQEKKVFAHSFFIKTRCPKLYSMILLNKRYISNTPKEKEYNENGQLIESVDMDPSIKYQIFIGFLNYIYTDHLVIAPHLRGELAALALKMGLTRLAALCKSYTYRLRKVEKIPESTFSKEIIESINELEKADLKFKIKPTDDCSIPAHKFILAQRNLYFKTMFECSFKEKDQNEFLVGDEINDEKTFKLILEYIYGNNENIINDENAVDILCLADRFMIEDLKYLCEHHLEQMVLSNKKNLFNFVNYKQPQEQTKSIEIKQEKEQVAVEQVPSTVQKEQNERELFDSGLIAFDNICILMQISDRFLSKRLKRICMETISLIDSEIFKTLNINGTLKEIRNGLSIFN
ncbi:hypothetical protein DICPUDRAFT_97415 [Dictyostelium purpureum]|uniref:BTB domain-containing protein n=1 Tax=Dictyostelium purpureum TaxID=5786 RepID=F0ZGI8_DICPU|nr:uncharacterized protein DICPUDRAFT_97415 [Dictyostelium purpureum]EGC36949.1 hypothetical protein DICPUDRAFT_97415 [Dictyostelium purpureum]|eukprot:XP_003286517.1 hypothetical protein DICPUDRAFT_97415 [Dictyostelium purpureum]